MDSCSSKEHYRPSVNDEHDMLPNLWFRLSGTGYHLTLTVLCLSVCLSVSLLPLMSWPRHMYTCPGITADTFDLMQKLLNEVNYAFNKHGTWFKLSPVFRKLLNQGYRRNLSLWKVSVITNCNISWSWFCFSFVFCEAVCEQIHQSYLHMVRNWSSRRTTFIWLL
jgi:hypothetical protein